MARRRRSQRWLLTTVAACVFGTVLAAWTLAGSTSPAHIKDATLPQIGVPTAPASSGSSSASGSGSVSPPRTGSNGFPVTFPIGGSNIVNIRGGAQHRVTLEATSDSSILRLLYYVADGHPGQGQYTDVHSPVIVSTLGRGDNGPIAEIWMQAGIYASVVSCTITVDGTVRSQQTAHGPHNVAICIA